MNRLYFYLSLNLVILTRFEETSDIQFIIFANTLHRFKASLEKEEFCTCNGHTQALH
jgi:hypothetical protein